MEDGSTADAPLAYWVDFQSSVACPLQATEEYGEIVQESLRNVYVADAEKAHSSVAGGGAAAASLEKDFLGAHPVPLEAAASEALTLRAAAGSPWDRLETSSYNSTLDMLTYLTLLVNEYQAACVVVVVVVDDE